MQDVAVMLLIESFEVFSLFYSSSIPLVSIKVGQVLLLGFYKLVSLRDLLSFLEIWGLNLCMACWRPIPQCICPAALVFTVKLDHML